MRPWPLLILWLLATPAGAHPFLDLLAAHPPSAEDLERARELLAEGRPLRPRGEATLAPFHRRPALPAGGRRSLCQGCHDDPPHRRSVRTRAFLNAHTATIDCLTCHLPGRRPGDYRWLAYDGADAGRAVPPPAEGLPDGASLAPRPGARIAPFQGDRPLVLFADAPAARELLARWQAARGEARVRLHARLHAPLQRRGAPCRACHAPRPERLDLAALGARGERLRDLTHNPVADFFARYRRPGQRLSLEGLLP